MDAANDPGPPAGAASSYPVWPGSVGPGSPAGRWPGRDAGSPPSHPHRDVLIMAVTAVAVAVAVVAAVVAFRAVRGTRGTRASQQIAARVGPGLADVTATLRYRQVTSAGTGMVLTPEGEVLTSNHVIEGATSLTVADVGNGRTYQAVVAGYDLGKDIAVLKLTGTSGLTTVTVGSSSAVRVGEKVFALGNVGGEGGTPSVASGTVTALNQPVTASDELTGTSEQLTGLLETNAPIVAGDSGGPLVNSSGQVLGMDTAASAQYQFQGQPGQEQAFAIPIGQALSVARQIAAGTSAPGIHIGPTAFPGVAVVSSGAPVPGGTGAGVAAGSPAATAGLAAGDVITSLGGHAVTSAKAVQNVLSAYHPGDMISVKWIDQAGQARTAAVVVATGPAG